MSWGFNAHLPSGAPNPWGVILSLPPSACVSSYHSLTLTIHISGLAVRGAGESLKIRAVCPLTEESENPGLSLQRPRAGSSHQINGVIQGSLQDLCTVNYSPISRGCPLRYQGWRKQPFFIYRMQNSKITPSDPCSPV